MPTSHRGQKEAAGDLASAFLSLHRHLGCLRSGEPFYRHRGGFSRVSPLLPTRLSSPAVLGTAIGIISTLVYLLRLLQHYFCRATSLPATAYPELERLAVRRERRRRRELEISAGVELFCAPREYSSFVLDIGMMESRVIPLERLTWSCLDGTAILFT